MTKKEQIIELAKKHIYVEQKKTQDGCYTGPGGFEELADEILALPLDVPGDEEIHKMAYNACMKPSMPSGEPEPEHVYYDAYIHGSNDMRSEILKRNTP